MSELGHIDTSKYLIVIGHLFWVSIGLCAYTWHSRLRHVTPAILKEFNGLHEEILLYFTPTGSSVIESPHSQDP